MDGYISMGDRDDDDPIAAQDTLPAQETGGVADYLPTAPTMPMPAISRQAVEGISDTAAFPAVEERRRVDRHAAAFVVRLRLSDTQQYLRCLSRDVGEGGVLVLMPELPAIGSHLECVMVHPDTGAELRVRARVVRHANTLAGRGAGIAFDEMAPAQRARLATFFGLAG